MSTTSSLPFTNEVLLGLLDLAKRLSQAKFGERRSMVEAHARHLGRSVHTVYGWLQVYAGWTSGRKRRADAGTTSVDLGTLEFVGAARREGVRANGKETMPIGVAMNIADINGMAVPVSPSQMARLLRQQGMDTGTVTAARTTQELRALYPNHVHQVDPSLCLLFYMGGKQHLMTDSKFYKNKLEAISKVKLKVWRYVRYDRASGVIDVQYYEAAGENQSVLFDFLMHTWGKQPGRLNYGRPEILLWDKGSANTSHAICNFLDAMGVRHETHAAGHAWAKGGVESANNIVETQFESRLKIEPVAGIDELNSAVVSWCRDYNSNSIKHIDSRLRRASGQPLVRDDLWNLILQHPGALVELPARDVCAWFLSGKDQSREVRNLQVSFVHPELKRSAAYDLRPWAEHLFNKQRLVITPLLLREGAVRIQIPRAGAEPLLAEVAPVAEFTAYGESAAAQVIGAGYVRPVMSAGELVARRLAEAAYGEGTTVDGATEAREDGKRPFAHLNEGTGLVAHSHLGQEPQQARLLPAAAEVSTDAVRQATRRVQEVEAAPLSQVEAAKALRALLGDLWTAEHFKWLAQRYPSGVPEADLPAIAAEIRNPAAIPKTALRAV